MIRGICGVSCIVARLQWAAVFKRKPAGSSSIWGPSTAPKATRNNFRKDAIGLTGEPLAIFEAALKKYTSALAEWDERVKGAKTYSDVCMKQERDGELVPMPRAISALGETTLKKARAVMALEYRCACVCVSCGRKGARASRTRRCAATDVQAVKLGREQRQLFQHHHVASCQAVFRG